MKNKFNFYEKTSKMKKKNNNLFTRHLLKFFKFFSKIANKAVKGSTPIQFGPVVFMFESVEQNTIFIHISI